MTKYVIITALVVGLLYIQLFGSSHKKPMYEVYPEPIPQPKYVYKVYPSASVTPRYYFPIEGGRVPESYEFNPTPLDISSGFVHITSGESLHFVLDHFYSSTTKEDNKKEYVNKNGQAEVSILKIDYPKLASFYKVKWEQLDQESPICPHLYASRLTGEFVLKATTVEQEHNSWDGIIESLTNSGFLVK